MNKYTAVWMLGLSLAFYACAPSGGPQPPPAPVVTPQPERVPETGLAQRLAALPGGEAQAVDGQPALHYPSGSLFAEKSVIPLPGGTAVLDPLVELIKVFPQQRWRFVMAANTEHGDDYDRRLAQQRRVLIERYLKNRGVDLARIEFSLDEQGEAPLQVVAVETVQASSSEVGNE